MKTIKSGIAVTSIFILVFLGVKGVKAENVGEDNYVWITIQDDDGVDESYWGVCFHPGQVICKIINLDINPNQIKKAKIWYKIGYAPYFSPLKKHFNKPVEGINWANIQILVNDEVAIETEGIFLATRGCHEISIKPQLLEKGENTIKFRWSELSEDNPKNASYGGFYMAIDTSKSYNRSCSSKDGGFTFDFDTLRPGQAPDERWQGEYMIRLKIALSAK